MVLAGYFAAAFMGLVLGLIGAGGSILTLPILVYLLDVNPVTATGYSLLIVGITALFGAYKYHQKRLINYTVTALFSVPAIIAVYFTRKILVPLIPYKIAIANFVILSKDNFIIILFAFLMLVSSYMMIRDSKLKTAPEKSKFKFTVLVIIEGLFVGMITGIVGAGGGFLIIPALVLLVGLDMKKAVGSSLLIIALKSLIGFIGDIENGIYIDYYLLAIFIACSITGMIIGTRLSTLFKSKWLKKIFGYLTLILSIGIIYLELH